jgi:hypothetical protein
MSGCAEAMATVMPELDGGRARLSTRPGTGSDL